MKRCLWQLAGPAALLAVGACSSKDSNQDTGATGTTATGMGGSGGMTGAGGGGAGGAKPTLNPALAAATTAGDYTRPFDSVPDSTATNFYFTAMSTKPDANGNLGLGVFKVPAAGGAATVLYVGAPFVAPFGIAISGDDKTLFVADHAAGGDPAAPDNVPDAPGGIYTLPTSGGTPTLLMGTSGFNACGLDVGQDQLFFAGTDPKDGKPGLFKVAAAGGMPSAVSKGDVFRAPCGVAITNAGDTYVADALGSSLTSGRILKVDAEGNATEFLTGLSVGFPAGIAITMDQSTLLVSGHDAVTSGSVVFAVDIATKAITSFNKGIEASVDSGGLHRARGQDVMSWCGVTTGTNGGGIVFKVTLY